jgi:NTE family protein
VVGGLFAFSGYSVGELRGNYYAVARSGYFYRLYDLPVAFGTAIYLGGWIEGGNVWQNSSDIDLDDPLGSFTLALAIDTRFGPVYLAQGVADDGERQFYFRLGNSF